MRHTRPIVIFFCWLALVGAVVYSASGPPTVTVTVSVPHAPTPGGEWKYAGPMQVPSVVPSQVPSAHKAIEHPRPNVRAAVDHARVKVSCELVHWALKVLPKETIDKYASEATKEQIADGKKCLGQAAVAPSTASDTTTPSKPTLAPSHSKKHNAHNAGAGSGGHSAPSGHGGHSNAPSSGPSGSTFPAPPFSAAFGAFA